MIQSLLRHFLLALNGQFHLSISRYLYIQKVIEMLICSMLCNFFFPLVVVMFNSASSLQRFWQNFVDYYPFDFVMAVERESYILTVTNFVWYFKGYCMHFLAIVLRRAFPPLFSKNKNILMEMKLKFLL